MLYEVITAAARSHRGRAKVAGCGTLEVFSGIANGKIKYLFDKCPKAQEF